jgi:hypothetical protein
VDEAGNSAAEAKGVPKSISKTHAIKLWRERNMDQIPFGVKADRFAATFLSEDISGSGTV